MGYNNEDAMIRNIDQWNAWERKWIASEKQTLSQSFRLFESMLQEARHIGAFPPKDPLSGISDKIEFIRRLHVRRAA